MEVLALVPAGWPAGGLPGARLVACADAVAASAALRASSAPAAIVSDGLAPEEQRLLEAAVRGRPAPVVEVRGAVWDGRSWSPLSAACRGVISGFGANGLRAAVELLASGK